MDDMSKNLQSLDKVRVTRQPFILRENLAGTESDPPLQKRLYTYQYSFVAPQR